LADRPTVEPDFLLDPFILKQGITLIWAATSTGKSPLTWYMAHAIGTGTHFFGLPCKQARVLYMELDTPEVGIVPRIKKIPPAANVWWSFDKPLSFPEVTQEQREALEDMQRDVDPEVVFINTLRKVHNMDDKDSRTPKMVFSFFQYQFPKAALVFVHHERKQSQDPKAMHWDKESFSGSMHWLDDAQVGLQLQPFGRAGKMGQPLRLFHRKSQVSALLRPMELMLAPDGSQMMSPTFNELLGVYTLMNEREERGVDLDRVVAGHMGISLSTARRRRLDIERGAFPGSRAFLEREEGSDEVE
jgi:RecA-family ATPase